MRTPVHLVVLLVAAVLGGCASYDVKTDYDPAVRFDTLRTYAWADVEPTGNARLDREATRQRIIDAIDEGLADHGLILVDEDPDLLVDYHAVIDRRLDLRGDAPYGNHRLPATTLSTVPTYEVGTLIIHLMDPATDTMVWRGSGQARLEQAMSDEALEDKVHAVVDAVLKAFPPKGTGL